MVSKKIIVTFLALSLAVTLAGCEESQENQDGNEDRTRLVAAETISIVPDRFNDFFRITGVVEADEDVVVSSEISGRTLSLVERGQYVHRGDPIATLDDRMSRSQYEAARTSFELADDTYQRLQMLYEDEIISTQDYRSARAQRDQAQSQMEQAEKQLGDTRIDAPFDGRVEERFTRTGEALSPGMPVVRLVNNQAVKVVAGIPERYSQDVQEGSPVRINLRNYGGSNYESSISYASSVIDPDTRTYTVEITLENPDGNFKPDMVVDLFVQRRTIENAIIIPRTAIIRDEEGTNVFIASEQNGNKVAELVPVRTGPASGAIVQIMEGLQEGDEIVIAGMSTLSSGDRLNILTTTPSNDKAEELQRRDRPVVSY